MPSEPYDLATERAVIAAMAGYPLEPDEVLWLGPKSVAILAAPNGFKGKLPDKHVYKKSELGVVGWKLSKIIKTKTVTRSPR